jgi:SAM-dependent methyltransferase
VSTVPEGRVDSLLDRMRALEDAVADLASRLTDLEARLVAAKNGRFAALYPAFEDRFRGSENDIIRKLAIYLPDVDRLVGTSGVLDIGPGRGEWLGMLHDRGVRAYGIDANAGFVARCRAKGLDVRQDDAVAHLRGLAPGSLDLVTAFHVIEHLDIEELLELVEAAHHALRPGGALLVETPNPTNLVMGACDFYNDPTHRSPLPPALTDHLFTALGFAPVEVRHVNPPPGAPEPGTLSDPLHALLAHRLLGPQDYAVLGFRPDQG